MPTALIVIANGFEEIESISVVDILRRGEVTVMVAGLDYPLVTSARGVQIVCDLELTEVKDRLFDMVILPGGEPGTTALQESNLLKQILLKHAEHKKFLAAICAAPRILDGLGLLHNRCATAYPGTTMADCFFQDAQVVEDGCFITANGPGASSKFALTLLKTLRSLEVAETVRLAMLIT